MTNNYYADNYKNGSDGFKENDINLKAMNDNGKCNNCRYFHFGGFKCEKNADFTPITYTQQTDKGNFINVLKPSSCTDYERKGKRTENKEAATE